MVLAAGDGVFPHVPAMFQAGRNLIMESKPMWHPKTGWPGSFQFMSHHHRTKQFNQHHQQKQSLLSLFLIVVFFWHLYTLHFNQNKGPNRDFWGIFFAALLFGSFDLLTANPVSRLCFPMPWELYRGLRFLRHMEQPFWQWHLKFQLFLGWFIV